jgi:hypothetical protein
MWKVRNVYRTGTRLWSVWRTHKNVSSQLEGGLRTWTRWVSLMIKLRPDCLTNTSLRTFIVRAGLNEQAFEQTIVQDWPTSQYNTSSSGSRMDVGTVVLWRIFTNTHGVTSRQEHGYECLPSRCLYPISAGRKKCVSRVVVRIHRNRTKIFLPTCYCYGAPYGLRQSSS